MRSSYWRAAGFEDRKIDVNWQFLTAKAGRSRQGADAQVPGGQPDFNEKGDVRTGDEQHCAYEEQGNGPCETRSEKGVGEQGDYDERNQYRRAAAHRDRGVDVSRSPLEHAQIVMYLTGIGRMASQ